MIEASPKSHRGVTLLECLLVVCIIAVLSLAAVPSFQHYYASVRSKAMMHRLFHHLMLAKSKALESKTSVGICPKGASHQCGTNWQNGWLVFEDNDANNQLDTNEKLYQVSEPVHSNDTLTWRGFGRRNTLAFGPDGFLKDMTAGAFHYCADTGQEQWLKRALVLNVYGRARFSRDENNDGVHEIRKNAPIQCG